MTADDYLTDAIRRLGGALRGPSVGGERDSILRTLAESDRPRRRATAAEWSKNPKQLSVLAADSIYTVRVVAAANPFTPGATLTDLADDRVSKVRLATAKNLSTPGTTLESLSLSGDHDIRTTVAGNWSTPPECLSHLSKDRIARVRQAVGTNEMAPADAAVVLAGDSSIFPVFAITDGVRSFSEEQLRELATSEVEQFRYAVAEHRNTPPDVLTDLADDDGVRPGRYIGHWIPIRAAVAENRNTPVEVLTDLATFPDGGVRWGVARNTRCTVDILLLMAADPDVRVRAAVAAHRSCRAAIGWQLSSDEDINVRRAVAGNSRFPKKLRDAALPPVEPLPPPPPPTSPIRAARYRPHTEPEPDPVPTECDNESCASTLCVAGVHIGNDILDYLEPVASASQESHYPGGGNSSELHEIDGVYFAWSENGGWTGFGQFRSPEAAVAHWRDWYGIDDWEEEWEEPDDEDTETASGLPF